MVQIFFQRSDQMISDSSDQKKEIAFFVFYVVVHLGDKGQFQK